MVQKLFNLSSLISFGKFSHFFGIYLTTSSDLNAGVTVVFGTSRYVGWVVTSKFYIVKYKAIGATTFEWFFAILTDVKVSAITFVGVKGMVKPLTICCELDI